MASPTRLSRTALGECTLTELPSQRAQPAVAGLGKGGTILKGIILAQIRSILVSNGTVPPNRVLRERISRKVYVFGNFGFFCTQRNEVRQNAVFGHARRWTLNPKPGETD